MFKKKSDFTFVASHLIKTQTKSAFNFKF